MRNHRVLASLVTVGLLGMPVVAASSATAEEPVQIQTKVAQVVVSPTLKAYKKPTQIHGQKFSFSASIQALDPSDNQWKSLPSGGQYVVERRLAGQKGFKAIKSGTTYGTVTLSGLKVVRNAVYRVRFLGGSGSVGGTPVVMSPSAGKKQLRVMRKFGKLKVNKNKRIFRGKVAPKYKRKRVIIQRKNCEKGCKWKPYAKVKTNKKSVFAVKMQVRKGKKWFYRAVIPKNKAFVKSVSPHAWIVLY